MESRGQSPELAYGADGADSTEPMPDGQEIKSLEGKQV